MQDQHLLTEIAASLAQIAQAMQSQNRPVQPLGFIQNQVETVYVNLASIFMELITQRAHFLFSINSDPMGSMAQLPFAKCMSLLT